MPLAENDTVSTLDHRGGRVWLYPLRVVGRYVRARTWFSWALVAALFIGPWIDVNGNPAMFFDIPERRFYFWGLKLFATDASYLLFLFGAVVFSIFFFTATLGRVWCGWACPQTVFLESIIRPIEQLIEGPPSARKRLDAAPWTGSKIARKVAKHAAFVTVAGLISTTAVAYFLGREQTIEAQLDPLSHPVGTAFFVVLTGLLYFDFAWFREQTCIVVCPYGRFQSVLMDADSLSIGYDVARGEPRGKPAQAGVGDCVDCRKCVQVCPTGIDIRKGVQMECVNCAACIDACDSVMDKLGRAHGLIRYASENALAGRRTRILRPRVVAYGVALVGVLAAFVATVSGRDPVELHLNRLAGEPYVALPDGRLQNMMRLRISNKTGEPRTFSVEAVDAEDVVVSPMHQVTVAPGAVEQMPVLLIRRSSEAHQSVFRVRVRDDHGGVRQLEGTFLGRGSGES